MSGDKEPIDKEHVLRTASVPPLSSVDESSVFESYVRGCVEITKSQFKVIKQYKEIYFSRMPEPLPDGMAAIPVRIVEPAEDVEGADLKATVESDAGYLRGRPGLLREVFNLLGIQSAFSIQTDIDHFGYNFFRDSTVAASPEEGVPIGPGYVIGPGDEVRITVWGKVEGQWNVVVNRDGTMSLPKIGVIGVAGLTFEQLKNLLRVEFGKYYTGFEMNVSMGALRTITVYVVGSARRPGTYTLSSLSTVINALIAAGGSNKTGTMRDIQLKREGRNIAHLDLYDLLSHGDKSEDMRLMSEDVIFIPSIGPLAAVAGSVNKPAIYEIKGEMNIIDLIEMAGGFSDIAFKGRIQVERITDEGRQIVFEIGATEAGDTPVHGGDTVKVFPYIKDRKVVRIAGAVHMEGEYGFRDGMTVKDLLELAGGLKYYAFREEAELTRVRVSDKGPVTERIAVNIDGVMANEAGSNILLEEYDYIFVRTAPEWQLYRTVTVSGEVMFPGTYTIKKGERLSSLIKRAGGFTNNAYLKGAVFVREEAMKLQQQRFDEMIERLERELFSVAAIETSVALTPGEARIEEIQTEQKREFVAMLKRIKAKGRIAIRIGQPDALADTQYDIELEDGDSLVIPENPMSIQVIGSVYNQMYFVYDENLDLPDYIELSGGYTENADKKRVYVLKADGTAVKARGGIKWSGAEDLLEAGGSNPEPGDTIVVPEKLTKIAWLREVKDITQILYQIAVTAGVIIVAF
jgi:protein involved in polysaccharide export with SLBB domain